ncbi:MAG: hypothetical protein DHS80DRAFT_31774 [Piptocephalis tieghemiana]|nr:MAG: hypothetical protein DHS80DRAFT_31774 [Piptocephalis tieghemiana]
MEGDWEYNLEGANNSAKRQAQANAYALRNLQIGLLVVNLIYILIRIGLYRPTYGFWHLLLYCFTAGITALLYRILASPGNDLYGPGLTSYMFDVIYVTWFVHLGVALISDHFWWIYLVIPSYALYKIVSLIRGGGIPGMPMPAMTQNQGAQNEGMSKTQQKKAARSQGAQSRQRVKTNR